MVELPPAVRRIAENARGAAPVLVFDLAAVEATMTRVMAAARTRGVRVLLAVKAFPHAAVVGMAARMLDGLDVAGPEERVMAAAAGGTAGIVSVTDPALEVATLATAAGAGVGAGAGAGAELRVTCETVAQVVAVRAARPDAAIALRVSMSAIVPGDPGVGALQAGDGHRRSRFGVEARGGERERERNGNGNGNGNGGGIGNGAEAETETETETEAESAIGPEPDRDVVDPDPVPDAAAEPDAGAGAGADADADAGADAGADADAVQSGWRELRAMIHAARGARVGLHVHSAGVVPASAARWGAIASAVMAVARACELEPAFIDLGGSWHGVGDRLDAAFAAVRAVVPAGIEVAIEPGRLFATGAGFAIGRVAAARRLIDRELRVTTLSRIAHLRWSPVELIARAPAPGTGVKVTFAGATCFEDDVIGDWIVEDPPPIGATVAWAGVTGYSLAWNRGFSGVPAATIVVTS